MNDAEVRDYSSKRSMPDYVPSGAFVRARELSRSKVAIVSTGGLRTDDAPFWDRRDEGFRVIEHAASSGVRLGIWSPNFDRTGWLGDPNVIFPTDLISDFARQGRIGEVAPRHISFMGALQGNLSNLRNVGAPTAAKALLDDGVDVALFLPVCPACTVVAAIAADVFEAAGIATLTISLVRAHAERLRPPRALNCAFPFGRPLGLPGDRAFQADVLQSLFAMLENTEGPILADYPISLSDGWDQPYSVRLGKAKASEGTLAEFAALRESSDPMPDYAVRAFTVPWSNDSMMAALAGFERIAQGTHWTAADLPAHPTDSSLNVRAFYEAAVMRSCPSTPPSRSISAWFYRHTQAGTTILDAQRAIRAGGGERDDWFFLAPYAHSLPLMLR